MQTFNLFHDISNDGVFNPEEQEGLLLRKELKNNMYQLAPDEIEKLRKLNFQLTQLGESIRFQIDAIAAVIRSYGQIKPIPYHLMVQTEIKLYTRKKFREIENPLDRY